MPEQDNEEVGALVEPMAEGEVVLPSSLQWGRNVGKVGLITLLVSGFGYLREATLAARFGVSTTMDAYFAAIFIPYLLYTILILGTLSPIFIPILLHDTAGEDPGKASETFSVITNFALLLLLVIVACGMIAAPRWLPLLFTGYSAATLAVTVRLVYIVFPAVLFLVLSGILTAALNGFHRFALPAFVPALSSMAIIAAALLARGDNAIYVVGVAAAVGFAAQALFLIPAAAALGLRYRLVLDLGHPAIKKLARLGGPLLLYLVVAHASVLVERNLASRLSAGAVSTLTYALRLFAAPSSFLAAPLAIVAYPRFAREALREHRGDLGQQTARMFRLVVFLFLPVTVWTVLNALPVTRVLYEHGRFLPADSVATARVLAIYGLAILPNALAIVLLRCLLAIEDTVTPLIAELISLALFVPGAAWLSTRWGITGLASARSVTFFLTAAMLIGVLWKRWRLLTWDFELATFLAKAATASAAMGAVSWSAFHLLQPAFDAGGAPARLGVILLVLAVSGATYLALARLFQLAEAQQVMTTALGFLPGKRER